jgi:hypothetical protein
MIGRLLNKLGAPRGRFPCAALGLWRSPRRNRPMRRIGVARWFSACHPGSPTKYAQCVPPITKLWNVLAMGGSFPTCTGVGIAPEGEARL